MPGVDGGDGGAPRCLLTYPILPEAHALLEKAGIEVVVAETFDDDGILGPIASADAVITRGPAHLTARHITAGKRLRLIAGIGSGTDAIAVDTATELGIPVTSGAGVGKNAVTEWAIAAALALHRRLFAAHEAVSTAGFDWDVRLPGMMTHELRGSTAAVIGLGHIGREVARVADVAFGVHVLGYDPLVGPEPIDHVERVTDLDEALDRCTTAFVHVPLAPGTRGLLGEAQLRSIGPSGVLVDAARGGVVDERALVEALVTGALGGAAKDVFDGEPPTADQLQRLAKTPNLILSPHVAGATHEAIRNLTINAVNAVIDVFAGRPPRGVANAPSRHRTEQRP